MTKQIDQNKLQEMQILEQNLQNILMQKQAFQIEVTETQNALTEIKKSGEDVFKIIGQLMIKTEKPKIKEELENKKKLLDIRLKTLEKQEGDFTKKLEEIRKELVD